MKTLGVVALLLTVLHSVSAQAENYTIDTEGAHAFIQFKISHLGYSWLLGRFNHFSGNFSYDANNPAAARVTVSIDMTSIDSNHAERDKHLRDKDFFAVQQYPTATFVSTGFQEQGDSVLLTGDLTLRGVTKSIQIEAQHLGHGPDPWGGYRRGFAGEVQLNLADFGLLYELGPASKTVQLFLSLEGVRQDK